MKVIADPETGGLQTGRMTKCFERYEFQKRSYWGISGTTMWPLIYFRKPKWMTEDDYQYVMGCLRLDLDPYYEFSGCVRGEEE